MLSETLKNLYIRDLQKLKQEISLYKQEQKIWYIEKEILNSAGNLCLHLVGNLNTYIGKELGNTGYVRNRDLEFSQKDISRDELIQKVEDTIRVVDKTMSQLKEEQLKEEYPVLVFREKTSTEYMLVHLATHLGYHLGQVNYHRRLLDRE